MADIKNNLSEFLGKYVELMDGRKGFVLAPSGGGNAYQFLCLMNRLGEFTFKIDRDDGFREIGVYRELGDIRNDPMQPGVSISDILELMKDGKRFRELQRLLK